MNGLYQSAVNDRHRAGALERIFEAGFAIRKLRAQRGADPAFRWRARAAPCALLISARWTIWSGHLSFLASVGSVSPYVGLFGTVWGIMNAFRGLANVNQATWRTSRPALPKR